MIMYDTSESLFELMSLDYILLNLSKFSMGFVDAYVCKKKWQSWPFMCKGKLYIKKFLKLINIILILNVVYVDKT